ncbi:hypothetical protein BJF86_02395 [Serinicoccus sp. CNJ-927]|uniref:O-antigen ligase family protein n=1 Tax=Serinicoccus sp. CNJ-927 TaxID=1904970 RepID=UPI00095F514A|nr:O-antigen ligase family protein [Serinicoccus sp. CNJ-927]OLT41877.1 hypothetical protein BJF86_02395 [Serinicoccus sp. CNJ-927]
MAITTLGGYLGMFFPAAVIRTPLSMVMPGGLLGNELVNHMVVRRFAQFDPDGYFAVEPRPSAPFLYTNNWGNAYSLLVPFAVLYLVKVRGTRRFWIVLAVLLASVVPAGATLNRGMFLGLGIAAVYLSFRYVLLGNFRVLLSVVVVGLLGFGALTASTFDDRIDDRVEDTSTTEDRAEIYIQTIRSVQEAPLFGMGAPRPSANPNIPPVGTHGQFWMVLHSHGFPGIAFFLGWFALAFALSLRRNDDVGLVANAMVLVGLIEILYYGALPVGLMLMMISAALALRPPSPQTTAGARTPRVRAAVGLAGKDL